MRNLGTIVVLAISIAASFGARAAHPLETEDTATQGTNNIEWENGLAQTWSAGGKVFVYQPQFSLGASPTLDLIVQPSWIRSVSDDTRGLGDTNLDVKWRFYGQEPLSLAVRAGVVLATSEHSEGLPHGTLGAHAVLVATYEMGMLTFHANLGMAHNPQRSGLRRTVAVTSGAAMWTINENLVLTAEADWSANSDPSHQGSVATLLAGFIYTIKPGLDFDIGAEHIRGSPNSKGALMGLTYRFGI